MDDKIIDAVDGALDRYVDEFMSGWNVGDLVKQYGSITDLARAVADYQGVDFKRGNQDKSVRRWLNFEKGVRGSQARNPFKDKRTAKMLKDLFKKKLRPPKMDARINGKIEVSEDVRDRVTDVDDDYDIDAAEFLDAFEQDDQDAALDSIYADYCPGMTASEIYDIDIYFYQ
jgi:hypothetical protein